jgi:hypothetical protein
VRYVSGLHAGDLLLKNGFLQELGALQRSIADFEQDATFLALALICADMTDLHSRFLKSFWEEEPSYEDYLADQKNKDEISRSKIQSYIARSINDGTPDHQHIATSKYLSRTYSGYVHGAAPHLMDMYNPDSRKFDVSGMANKHLLSSHGIDFENYLFRGVCLMAIVAKALGETKVHTEAMALHAEIVPYFTE